MKDTRGKTSVTLSMVFNYHGYNEQKFSVSIDSKSQDLVKWYSKFAKVCSTYAPFAYAVKVDNVMKVLYTLHQGPRGHLKSEGAQGGFFRATFYCIFGRFGGVTHLALVRGPC